MIESEVFDYKSISMTRSADELWEYTSRKETFTSGNRNAFISEHLRDCKRVLNDRGSFFLNLGDTFYNGNLQNVPHRVVVKIQLQGWILRNTIIWAKTNPKPSSSKTNLTPSYEFIFHLIKSGV